MFKDVDIFGFCQFLEDYNRYKVEIYREYLLFNKLSNGISFVFVT